MKTVTISFLVAVSLCLTPATFGQRALDKAEVQDVLKRLTSQPRKTWIPAGTIQATHQEYGAAKVTDETLIKAEIDAAIQQYAQDDQKRELTPELQDTMLAAIPFNVRYKLANEYSMSSRETVKYDGERFYWDITVNSRTDTVKPSADLASNSMTDAFDMTWNQHRICAWDGQEYTTYSASGGQAMVDAAGKLSREVNGPLTAGLIPWGYGRFSDASLSAAGVSAGEVSLNGTTFVQMAISYPDGTSAKLALDPSKDYAVTTATLASSSGFVVTYTCSGYQSISGRWAPTSVTIERQNDRIESKAPTSEQWTFTSISTSTPALSSFDASLGLDTLVEYASPVMASSALYINSYEADTDELLAQRLAYGAAEGSRPQNCATAALQYVASGFGKSASNAAIANLIGPDGRTSLYDLKQLAQSMGLYGRVVKTDPAGLENLGATKAVLHIPGTGHFVVLDRVDNQYVWLIDLSSRKFYYRQNIHLFPLEWTEGTALLLSNRPIAGQLAEVPDAKIKEIVGGVAYACNRLGQEEDWIGCDYIPYELCAGAFAYYYERWACGPAESGTCPTQVMVFRQETPCIPDPIYDCKVTGVWYFYSRTACK